ncbi:hypothetical protein ARMGADRAFT_816891 [Armillaria gallica]|uniref:Uncharacterized protein n=1 Tax=Armillaria gallica TaxID=47427 RepID=A0A2H3CGG8_ARMGA|nr:hypothetical protein ARMGADRAFT_816891 [Armillaria gallica]
MTSLFRQRSSSHRLSSLCPRRLNFTTRRCPRRSQYIPCKDVPRSQLATTTSSSRFCTKTMCRASGGTRLRSTMTGDASIWREVFVGSDGWVPSLLLIVRGIPADSDLFDQRDVGCSSSQRDVVSSSGEQSNGVRDGRSNFSSKRRILIDPRASAWREWGLREEV